MAIDIKFDLAGNPEPPTIILATRSGQKLGQLEVEPESINLSDKFNDASEITFTLNKYVNGKLTYLWDSIVDFKLVYCKEWDLWFEIKVELDEETETIKTVFCTQLGQAELSQIMLYNIEINTEADIEREDYKISILWDEEDPKTSILDRLLEKAPHYSIIYVDDSIKNIQRSFSFDGTSVYDAFQEIAEEIGCLFVFHSNSGENGKIQRTISVYDLQQKCIDCGYRGEFTDKCPKCGSKNIKYGYGEDTLIFVTSDELASSNIQFTTDVDSVKNCFKLEAGDDLMTATIRNCNPNGTDYIWYISDSLKDDMSEELVEKIESYDDLYSTYYNTYESPLDENAINDYNKLVDKYSVYNEDLQKISSPVIGYSNLMNAYYNTIDLSLYLQSSLMPNVEMSDTTAEKEAAKLTSNNFSPVSINSIADISVYTANNAVLSMAKIIVDSRYKINVGTSSLERGQSYQTWTGNFEITNYSDDEDAAISETITVVVNDNYEAFVKQKIEKSLNKDNTDDLSISGLFKKDYDDFVLELKKYSLNCLDSFYKSCENCINILIEQGTADKETWSGEDPNLYQDLYLPYLQKMGAIEAEIKVRQSEVDSIIGVYDTDGTLKSYGLQNYIVNIKDDIQKKLDFQSYLGVDLWLEFCTFRREDKYSNDNYISDGLDNNELFKNALEFIQVANDEIYKSAERQHSISTSLKNLLLIEKFKPLVKYFNVGNWIRIQVDDNVYKLRLLEYSISFGSLEDISVEFSDILKIKSGITDVQNVLSQASSMATSYNAVQRQSKQGNEAQSTLEQWYDSGLNSALINIKNNDNEEITFDNNGILARSYDDITEKYNPKQLRITHNVLALTDDDWETVSLGIGEHDYNYYDSNGILTQGTGYGVSAKFLSAGYINGSQIIGGEIFSQNYSSDAGTYMNLNDGTFSWAGGKITYNGSDLILTGVNLSWIDIKDAPSIPSDEYITKITKDTVTTEYVNALNITAGSVAAENITGNSIQGKTVIVGGENNGDGSIVVKDNSGGIICTIDKSGIVINSKAMKYTDEKVILSGTILADGITYSGFTIGDYGLVSECYCISQNYSPADSPAEAYVQFSNIDLTGYSKLTIVSSYTNWNTSSNGVAYVRFGIDDYSSEFFNIPSGTENKYLTFEATLDISNYSGKHLLVFHQYAYNQEWSWAMSSANLNITSITLSN